MNIKNQVKDLVSYCQDLSELIENSQDLKLSDEIEEFSIKVISFNEILQDKVFAILMQDNPDSYYSVKDRFYVQYFRNLKALSEDIVEQTDLVSSWYKLKNKITPEMENTYKFSISCTLGELQFYLMDISIQIEWIYENRIDPFNERPLT